MILEREQINRYLRHIIIPEISGPGQKKLTESKVHISAYTVEEASSLIYYLAAIGAGSISCSFIDNKGYDKLFSNIKDLNGDVAVELINSKLAMENKNTLNNEASVVRILISKYDNLKACLMNFSNYQECSENMPLIMAINCGWKAYIKTITNQQEFNYLLSNPKDYDLSCVREAAQEANEEKEGSILSACLLGALAATEHIKLCLKLGTILDKPLYFDLLSMKFNKSNSIDFNLEINNFIKECSSERQLHTEEKKLNNAKKLSESKVLIVGTGGLGSPAAYALSSIGIGTIGFVDYDTVEISNLNRQILHSTSRIGIPKVESAESFIKSFNPDVNIVTHYTSLNISNAIDIISDYDVIIDAVDNFPTRYLLNDACFFANKPLVDAAAVKFCGLIMTIMPKVGPCYRCLFPPVDGQNNGKSCSEAGVLGPVPGVMGFMQAAEVVKLLLGRGDTLQNRIVYYDALDFDFDTIGTDRSINCDLCGTNPKITKLVEYKNACEGV